MRLAGKGFEVFVFGSATALLCLVIVAVSIGWQGGDTGEEERVASAAEVCGLAENLAGRAAVLEKDAPAAGLEGQVRALLGESMALGRKITEWRNADTRDASKAEGLADAAGTFAKTVAAMQSDLPEIERSTRAIDRARDLADDMIRMLLYDLAAEAAPRRGHAGIIPADIEEPRLLTFVPGLSEILEALAERPARQLAVPPLVAAASEAQGLAGALSAFNKAAADHAAVAGAWRAHQRALAGARKELQAGAGAFARAAITVRPRDNTERLWFVAVAAAVVWFAVGLVLLLSVLKGEDAPPRARRDATAAPRRRTIERTR
ncbi:MAG TPA: hypothetical protein DCM87_04885 [Planctomycetes bacterium]|nr:hypothetical protein [Planctomycetota bacterium]